ncbi:MAG: hypothetical protein HYX80_04750 [Chloroflexi bacterium]|nr:hypothetical protein [Chloroflexota bacterium]
MDELASLIDKVYREPYFLLGNNCIRKSLKIKAKAEELGKRADLITCISIVPIKKWHNFPTVNIHLYVEIEGKKVDVSLDPRLEEKYCKNSEKKLILPVNISKLWRILSRRTRPERSRRADSISQATETKGNQ